MFVRVANQLISWPRGLKRLILVVFDFFLLFAALWASYVLRLGQWYVPNLPQLYLMVVAPVLAVICFQYFGVYRVVIRYITEKTFWAIANALTISVLLWLGLIFMAELRGILLVPRSVPVIYGVFGALLVGASRVLARRFLGAAVEDYSRRLHVVIYGAGPTGRQLAAALRADRHSVPVAFVDTDATLQRTEVLGLKVFPPDDLVSLVDSYGVHEVIVCGDSVEPGDKTRIFGKLAKKNIRVRFLPSVSGGFGDNLVDSIREMEIGDLLGRPVVEPDRELLQMPVAGQTVLVTGAGGSIGSELCRQIVTLSPRKLVMVEINEFALYEIDRRLRGSGIEVTSLLGSVADQVFVDRVFGEHAIDSVFHAAAYKHVPMIEANPLVGIANNVIGTWTVAEAARKAGVERFVLISTDKAVRPTSVMGATKRWSELIVAGFDGGVSRSGRRQHFCSVRFGNVIGSQGSVVPLFREQIERGGPVTLTDDGMTRYFMSVNEAVELIIQAASLSEKGEVFLLDMGQPVRIRELAENMIRLSGRSIRTRDNPDGDIEVIVTGTRPGEKLSEELVFDSRDVEGTRHFKILRVKGMASDFEAVRQAVGRLALLVRNADTEAARKALFDLAEQPAGATVSAMRLDVAAPTG
jgi:FlaA1/EpsC-like NDP-sugar epimerase